MGFNKKRFKKNEKPLMVPDKERTEKIITSYPKNQTAILSGYKIIQNGIQPDDSKYHKFKSNLPIIWGPFIWNFLHISALYYPEKPNKKIQQECKNFINSLSVMLPCPKCKIHYNNFINKQNVVDNACLNKLNLMSFFVELHNEINHRNGKPKYSIDEVHKLYENYWIDIT